MRARPAAPGMMLAAAPNICSLDLGYLPDEATLLQPLAHASQLQTLLIDAHDTFNKTVDAAQLVTLVRYLAAPPHEPHGGEAHCAALRCVRVSGWRVDGGVVDAAAALLEESGCSICLERGRWR